MRALAWPGVLDGIKKGREILPAAQVKFETLTLLREGIKIGFVRNTPRMLACFDTAQVALPEYYQKHVAGFYDKNYRFQSALCFYMLQKLAGRSIKVAFTEAGKPYSPAGGICFSFSHTATLALCAVAEFPVGIDASPRLAYDGSIAALVCSEAELERLKFSSDAGKLLTRYITRKESRIKLTGGTLRDIGEKREDMEHYRTIIVDGQVCSVCFKDKNAISNSL